MSKARIEKIMDLLNLNEENAKEIDKICTKITTSNSYDDVEEGLKEINDLIGGHGVENINRTNGSLIDNYWRECNYLYINMGDTYDQTVIYNTASNRIIIGDWGSIVERNLRLFN